ncbi:MAG: phosphate signaling complex protein PhoU [Candidatus Omnitrophica bacterium]|nr:phosphate signaling complex protein PhoU [Candidatus Omnitrophota bacterium]
MERRFDEELRQLKTRLFAMAGMAEQAIGKAVKALVDRQASLAQEVLREDAAINRLEVEIEDACLTLLARYQPEARDLRVIAMIFKIVNDLERVGDQGVNIAERTLDLLKEPLLKPLIDIPKMATLAQQMLKDVLDAFVNQDAELARAVCRRDDEVDRLNDQIYQELLGYMTKDPQTITRAVDLILVGRHLERVADHATNIAEDVYYLVRGTTIKHRLAGP